MPIDATSNSPYYREESKEEPPQSTGEGYVERQFLPVSKNLKKSDEKIDNKVQQITSLYHSQTPLLVDPGDHSTSKEKEPINQPSQNVNKAATTSSKDIQMYK